jgi:cupin 2 domain-containing protein
MISEAGDGLLIPAHYRHRVDWTDPEVWLAVHFNEGSFPEQEVPH